MVLTIQDVLAQLGAEWYVGPGARFIVEAEHGSTAFEVTEKRGPYREEWVKLFGRPEEHLLILEEITVRRLLRCAPYAYMLCPDRAQGTCTVYSAIDFLCMPKRRVDRIGGGVWLVDKRDGYTFPSMDGAVAWALSPERVDEFFTTTGCYRGYVEEEVIEI